MKAGKVETADMVKFVPREVSQGRNTETALHEEALEIIHHQNDDEYYP